MLVALGFFGMVTRLHTLLVGIFQLRSIDSVLSSGNRMLTSDEDDPETAESAIIIGLLTQLEEGKYYLEDLDAQVPIDFSHAVSMVYLYTLCAHFSCV